MELNRANWSKEDGQEFQRYLYALRREEKVEWTTRIINTQMEVLAIPAPEIAKIGKAIKKGNFLSFLDLQLWDYYENTAINAFLISAIADFEVKKRYLYPFACRADNWASCDALGFAPKAGEAEKLIELSKSYVKSDLPFVRRIGSRMLFPLVDGEYLQQIFDILDGFPQEKEYYVNMVNAWLVAECFTKRRDLTLEYLQRNKLNAFTVNKAVQKCRDSFRISAEDKEMLLRFKRKQ